MASTDTVRQVPSTGSAGEYRCKGSHVVQARRWVNERLGEGTFESLVAPAGGVWQANFLVATWYDVGPLNNALRAVGKRIGESVENITREITRQNALHDLRSIYRIFLSIAAPVRVMSFSPQLWSTYVKFGEAAAARNDPGHYVGECKGIPADYLEWACGAWLGFVPTTIEVAGGRNLRARISDRWVEPAGSQFYTIRCEIKYDL